MELIAAAVALASTIFTVLVGGWFSVRVHKLEERVDELELEQHNDRLREQQLIHHIYKLGGEPPPREEKL